ncbi:hypothetical protein [Microseira wollei]|uniref:Knr4/Smi1-like domain-containing protein n=1 Tax=Microseira wollei NIES-4236 TaxID=2530354 RepID=A0AAV3XA85_9CYAN|nr:hypothetical protein [Microseira wollei]GET39124.1 hypothetical protein MiSe_38880 [Microseira wollei NIES-4236]
MKDNNSIHQAIDRIHELGNVETGRGPKHPTSPNPQLASEIADFIDKYSFLKKDQSYVEFLECYAGLLLYRDNDFMSLGIYGFDDDVSLHLVKGEGELIDEAGMLTFADLTLPLQEGDKRADNLIGTGFAFDATQQRPWGVYRCINNQPYHWYCGTFLEWLEKLANQKGRLLEDPTPLLR